ncbi:hypothetical protein EEL30_18095 [Brevibacillus laterosporus]|uniref:Uncharacterized protein n=1 Tax=Brevibacillus laterosporus TaxID=1465 RepID=A0A518VAL5_BRELA|nr:hypothetical protein EEL30_18095 [Brevibacillus laterosporus]
MAVTPLNFHGLVFLDNAGSVRDQRNHTFIAQSLTKVATTPFPTKPLIYAGANGFGRFVSRFNRNHDGTIGEYISGNAWAEGTSNVKDVQPNPKDSPTASRVTGGFAFYTASDRNTEYLVGWSRSKQVLYRWDITGEYPPMATKEVEFKVAPTKGGDYNRGCWDGDETLYFYSSVDDFIYSWNVTTPTTSMVKIVKLDITEDVRNKLKDSYVGTGMLIKNGVVYMPSSASPTKPVDEALFAYDFDSGKYLGSLLTSELRSHGLNVFDQDYGCLQLNPRSDIAFLMSTITNSSMIIQYKTVFLTLIGDVDINDNIHNQNVNLTIKFIKQEDVDGLGDQAKFRILVNGVKVYPADSDFTDIQPTPYTATVNGVSNLYFNKVGRNEVIIEADNNQGVTVSKNVYVNVVNTDPVITQSEANPSTTHSDLVWVEATAETEAGDYMSYRFTINEKVYADWSDAIYTTPLHIRFMLRPSDLKIGNNSIKIEVKDNFKDNTNVSESTLTVVKTNTKPNVEVSVKGQTVFVSATDNDNDKVRFNVSINGNSFLPSSGMSPYYEVPFETSVDIPKQMIKHGQENTVSVSVQDIAGDIVTQEVSSSIEMSGLMFRDKNGSYYTTDTGELLKYLDVGSLKSGETSPAYQVWIENTTGYVMHGVVVKAIQGDLDSITEKIELSKEISPFTSVEYVSFTEPLQPNEAQSFFFRIVCNEDAAGGGIFKLKVYGKPSLT